jgi:glutamate/aspartate transport system substrate-binding protein
MLRASSMLIAFVVAGISVNSTSAQAVSGRLKSIVTSKIIKVAHRTDASPFSFVSQIGQPAGYTVDFCKRIVASLERQLGIQSLKIKWVPVTTRTRFDVVANGKADLECGSSTVTLSRLKQVDFSNYVFVESTGFAVRTASGIGNLKEIAGKKIAVIAGTSNERAVIRLNLQQQLNVIVVPVQDRDGAIEALSSGQVDGFASDKLLLLGTRFKDDQELRLLPDDISIEPYAIALPRGDWELRLAVNTALAEIFRSGEVKDIFNRWFSHIGLQPGILNESVYLLGAIPE